MSIVCACVQIKPVVSEKSKSKALGNLSGASLSLRTLAPLGKSSSEGSALMERDS